MSTTVTALAVISLIWYFQLLVINCIVKINLAEIWKRIEKITPLFISEDLHEHSQ